MFQAYVFQIKCNPCIFLAPKAFLSVYAVIQVHLACIYMYFMLYFAVFNTSEAVKLLE